MEAKNLVDIQAANNKGGVMRRLVLILMAVAVLGLVGCGKMRTRPVDSYVPESTTRYQHGAAVSVEKFIYVPASTGAVRGDQVENTAIGNVYLGVNIDYLVRKATKLELEKSGLMVVDGPAITGDGKLQTIEGAGFSIEGDILLFKADDLGFRVNWYYTIRYKILRKNTGETVFSREYSPPMMRTQKQVRHQAILVGYIHKVIANGVALFIQDEDVRKILDEPRGQ